jgi:hypothetical protein
MNYTQITGYPRYEIGDDRFTIRCSRPYKPHVAPHILRPFYGHRCTHAAYVNVRDASDKTRCVSVSRLAFLALGPCGAAVPSDAVPLVGFSRYSYSPSEGVVVRNNDKLGIDYGVVRLKWFLPVRATQLCIKMRSDSGTRKQVTLSAVVELAKKHAAVGVGCE